MDIIRHPGDMPETLRPCVAALGNFDGFHRGHQQVVGIAGRLARQSGRPLAVITTEPHPRHFFRPDDPPFRLTPFRERAFLLECFGVDILGSLVFDAALAAHSAEAFLRDILLDGFGVAHVVVGFDYRFGKGRGGDAALLRAAGERHGFEVTIVPPVTIGAGGEAPVFSSSLIRETLQAGAARRAAALLGHWWALQGRVETGERRGSRIGFPTANIAPGEALRPRHGVYAVRLTVEGEEVARDGVANFGRRPTFGDAEPLLEVHLFDFAGDLYGRHVRVEFVDFVREERKFDGIEALVVQIAADCATARAILAAPDNDRARLLPPRRADRPAGPQGAAG